MNCLQLGFLKLTESVQYFLPLLELERGQEIQEFSFAHAESLRQGTPEDKRCSLSPIPKQRGCMKP